MNFSTNFIQFDYARFFDSVRKIVLPTYISIKNKVDYIGTSFVCTYLNHAFIINAGHTIQNANGHELRISFPNGNNYSLYSCNTKYINDNKTDLAISDIPFEDIRNFFDPDIEFLDLHDTYRVHQQKFRFIIFTGFPCSGYKPYSNRPRAEFLSYTLPVLHSPYPLELADTVDPEYYIVGLRSRGKVLRVNDTKGLEMADMRGLKGISGGPCFLYDPEITSHPYFAGIGIGDLHRKGNAYVTALKIEAIIATLNDFLTPN